MKKDINIVDIATIAGVSVSTVSRVINNHPDVSEKTRKKVIQAVKDNDYIPNNSAQNLKRESMRAIGVIVKGFSNPFFNPMLTIIQEELRKNRYTMLLQQVDTDKNELAAAIALCKEKKPRALIFMGGNFKHAPESLAKIDLPYIMLTTTMNQNVNRHCFSSITIDDYCAAYEISDRICKAGHKNIAAISSHWDDISISSLRVNGFVQALKDNGVDFDAKQIAYAGEFSRQAGYDAAKHLLQQKQYSCIFCISDLIALGAMRAVYDLGFKLADEVSIVGFDGLEEGRYAIPSLATVKQPREEMAYCCVELLFSLLRKNTEHEHVLFDTEYVAGESFKAMN